jgi:hypothetical protein
MLFWHWAVILSLILISHSKLESLAYEAGFATAPLFWISEPSFLSCTLTRQRLVLTQTKMKILGPSCFSFFFFFWPFPKVLSRPCHGLCSLCLKYHNKVTSRSTYEKINNGLHPLHRVVFQNAVADFYDLSVLQRQVKGPFKT